MAYRPVYQNLDTSFINLSALVRYLRRRQFNGRIRLESTNYEADIIFTDDNKLLVREVDKLLGKNGEGAEAFQRILIRAREAGSTVNVYQVINERRENEAQKPGDKPVEKPKEEPKKAAASVQSANGTPDKGIVVSPEIKETVLKNGHNGSGNGNGNGTASNGNGAKKTMLTPQTNEGFLTERRTDHVPKFPFDLRSSVEERARTQKLSPADWQMLLRLTGELLGLVDKRLATAKLDFSAAFQKARSEISLDYPFMDPSIELFSYSNGVAQMRTEVSPKLFVTSINEMLSMILRRLKITPKFSALYEQTRHEVLALANHRKELYLKYSIVPHLTRMLDE